MQMTMDNVGYMLYSGLGCLILAFLVLLTAMVAKKEKVPLYEQALNQGLDDKDDVYEQIETEVKPNKKGLFSFGKKNKKVEDKSLPVYEELEDDYEYSDDKDDEYEDEFEFPSVEKTQKQRKLFEDIELDNNNENIKDLDDEDFNYLLNDDYKELEIKQYEDDEYLDDRNEEEELLKRIEMYKNKFNK